MNYKHILTCIGILGLGIVINQSIAKFDKTPIYNKVILAEESGEGSDDDASIIEPSAICNKFSRFYNVAVGRDDEGHTTASCSETSNADIVSAIASGDFSNLKPHLIMNTGQKVYFETSNWQRQPELIGDDAADEDQHAIRVYIDIDGDTGNSVLWEDIFPFYITESGKALPAKNSNRPGIAGSSNRYLSVNTIYDDYASGARKIRPIPNGSNLSFMEAACKTGYIRATMYCTDTANNNTLIELATVCRNSNGTIKEEADCRLKVKKPWNSN